MTPEDVVKLRAAAASASSPRVSPGDATDAYSDDDDGGEYQLDSSIMQEAEDILASYRKAAEVYEEQEANFESLTPLQALREFWRGKGLAEDDPAFLLVEIMGMFDTRILGAFHDQRQALKRNNDFGLSLYHGISLQVQKLEVMSERLEAARAALTSASVLGEDLAKTGKGMVEAMLSAQEANYAAIKEVDDKSAKATMLRYAMVAAAILLGMLIHAVMF